MKNMRLRAILFFAAASGTFILGAPGPDLLRVPEASAQATFQAYSRPQVLPEFSVESLEGNKVTVGDRQGQVLLINFWATW